MEMKFFDLLTPITYWLLIAMWSFILYFYLKRLRADWHQGSLMLLLFIILTIDAFRTLFESFYFGAWYTARVGLLPISIHDFLVQPQMVIIPKMLNVFAAGLIITILFRYWLPREGEEIKHLETTVNIRTRELSETVEKLKSEIMHRERMERKKKESEAKYMDLYENAPDMYASVNAKTSLIEKCNMTLANTLEYAKEEIIGRPAFEIYHPDFLEEAKNSFKLFVETGEIHDKELQLRRKDGSKLDVSLNASAVRGENGQILFSRSTLRDITEHKHNKAINAARLHLLQFAATHSLDELLEETLNEAEKLTDSLIGFYLFVEDDQKSFKLQNWSTRTKAQFYKAEGKGLHYPIAQAAVLVDCVYQGKPVIHNDYASLPHLKTMPEGHAEVLRELVVPVLRGEKIKAILGVGNKPADYTEKDVEAISLLCDLAWEFSERKRAEEELDKHREHLEELVRERTVELEASNRELEAFAYSVSHDLRAPLRHIDGFLELLEKKAGAVLNEQSRHYMDIISDAAQKMGLLIDDLLSFSRMGRQAMSSQPVDLEKLVRDVIREQEPDTAGRHIDWRIGDLPAVSCDAAMLRIVLANLIANALKFTRPRRQARIEIGSLPGQNSEAVIFVRDNGTGFDIAYADRLFGVFQRLHNADEFEGTGIGLATVRRIIARHDGRTWAEGKPDQGATFYFAVPQTLQGSWDE